MKKIALKKALLVSLLALPLFGCDSKTPDKTNELKPTTGEVVDKHAAVSTLGKAMKASASTAAISYEIDSTKDFSYLMSESIHNSIENTDTSRSFSAVASGISMDYRATTDDDDNKRNSSMEALVNQLHYEYTNASGSNSRNRAGVKLNSYVKNGVYYIDPSNKEFANTVYDFADYLGYGDYRTVLTVIFANKYYVAKSDLDSVLEKTGKKEEIEEWIEMYTDFSAVEEIDDFIVDLDGKIDGWDWLTTYADGNGDYTIYATMNKEEFCAFMDQMDPVEPGEERETYAEALANVNFTSLEFSVTFAETGLKSVGTVFALNSDEKNVAVYEDTIIPLPGTDGIPTQKQVGYEDIHVEMSGGFKMTFGKETPKDPGTTGWTDLKSTVEKYFKK